MGVYAHRLKRAAALRNSILSSGTNTYRWVNGEGDLMPGLVIDVYNSVAVMQLDGDGAASFWDKEFLSAWILANTDMKTVYYKPRHNCVSAPHVWGEEIDLSGISVLENGRKYLVNIESGQKTGFFCDQRDNRDYVQRMSADQRVLNLFSYTGGFSVAAGVGGARGVTSVDLSVPAIEFARQNWMLNGLASSQHTAVACDVFEFFKGNSQKFDVVICDPPSFAKSEKQKSVAIEKYIECFSSAAKAVAKGGHLMLSSCSSHIDFSDFAHIVEESLSKSRQVGRVHRVSGQGADHPYPMACPQLRYLKFYHLVLL